MRTFEYTGGSDLGAFFVDEKQKISVILSTAELNRFNSYCTEKGHKKSTLIRRLIREYLDREAFDSPAQEERASSLVTHGSGTRQVGRLRRKGG